VTDRAEIARRVDELAEELSGAPFAAAIQEYFEELDPESQAALREIVLERAANLDQAVMDRVDARGWFRRQWDQAGGDGPPRRW
jgi:hypothetical protein